jgi:hypothetical protein
MPPLEKYLSTHIAPYEFLCSPTHMQGQGCPKPASIYMEFNSFFFKVTAAISQFEVEK